MSPRGLAQEDSLRKLVDDLSAGSAWRGPVDASQVKQRAQTQLRLGDGSDSAFFGIAWRVLNEYPQGHQGLFAVDSNVCGNLIPYQKTSRFGVCGRPSRDGIAVTYARQGNRLGLVPGDVVVRANGRGGADMFADAYLRPACGNVHPAPSGQLHAGAASFFGTIPMGAQLTVENVSGASRTVIVPAEADTVATDCTDPFARSRDIYAEAQVRPDGVAVVRLPSLFPYDKPFPANATQADYEAFVAAYEARVLEVFESVRSATAIVWDIRGNSGGITSVGIDIVNGFASARAAPISYCRKRIPGSQPIAYDVQRFAEYATAPGGPFVTESKVAVLTDGLAYSAGDYFARAASRGSSALVIGAPSAGAYGGGRVGISIDGPPKLAANYDEVGCFDAATSQPIEGAPLQPTVAVEYDPADLAVGRDTILERAASALR